MEKPKPICNGNIVKFKIRFKKNNTFINKLMIYDHNSLHHEYSTY